MYKSTPKGANLATEREILWVGIYPTYMGNMMSVESYLLPLYENKK